MDEVTREPQVEDIGVEGSSLESWESGHCAGRGSIPPRQYIGTVQSFEYEVGGRKQVSHSGTITALGDQDA
jgi:hypothetical protein